MPIGGTDLHQSPPLVPPNFFPFWYDALMCPQGTGTIGRETMMDVTGHRPPRCSCRSAGAMAESPCNCHFSLYARSPRIDIGPDSILLYITSSAIARWPRYLNETVHHLLFNCRQWRSQRDKLYRALEKVGIAKPMLGEDSPEGRILGEPKATGALIQFLATTPAAVSQSQHQAAEYARRDDEWGLETLEQAEMECSGEG